MKKFLRFLWSVISDFLKSIIAIILVFGCILLAFYFVGYLAEMILGYLPNEIDRFEFGTLIFFAITVICSASFLTGDFIRWLRKRWRNTK